MYSVLQHNDPNSVEELLSVIQRLESYNSNNIEIN